MSLDDFSVILSQFIMSQIQEEFGCRLWRSEICDLPSAEHLSLICYPTLNHLTVEVILLV